LISQQKKQLYKNNLSTIFLFFFIAVSFTFFLLNKVSIIFFIPLLTISLIILYFSRSKATLVYQKYKVNIEDLQENLNLLNDDLAKKNSVLKDIPHKTKKIFSIKDAVEVFINTIEPSDLHQSIVDRVSDIFPEADNVLLFLFNDQKDTLALEMSVKRSGDSIKEKKGDVLDWWVLKNNQCLLVEDVTSDFRFDFNKVLPFLNRKAVSFLSSPVSMGEHVLGLVRIESKKRSAFSLEDSRVMSVICDVAAVVLERANLLKQIRELAIRDSLTNLVLRGNFLERFDEELERSALHKRHFGLLVLDIDDFKKINDTYGHVVGDMVLKKLASILIKNVGNSGNVICRMGGEEFVILMVESDKKKSKEIAESIRRDCENAVVKSRRKQISFTVSLGLVIYPDDGLDKQQLLIIADKLLYKAKEKGKNQLCTT